LESAVDRSIKALGWHGITNGDCSERHDQEIRPR
jgi:hypothetical protein